MIAPSLYITGGKATFTVVSGKSGERFTFRVRLWKDAGAQVNRHTVWVRGHGERNWNYLGIINRNWTFYPTAKSRFSAESPEVRGFAWVWRNADRLEGKAQFLPSGTCCCCGRQLTTPESIALGVGPECGQKLGRQREARALSGQRRSGYTNTSASRSFPPV